MPYVSHESTTRDPNSAKRERVYRVLSDPTCQEFSIRKMAKIAAVDESFVRKIKKQMGQAEQTAATSQKRATSIAEAASKVFGTSGRKGQKKASQPSRSGSPGKGSSASRKRPTKALPRPKKKQPPAARVSDRTKRRT